VSEYGLPVVIGDQNPRPKSIPMKDTIWYVLILNPVQYCVPFFFADQNLGPEATRVHCSFRYVLVLNPVQYCVPFFFADQHKYFRESQMKKNNVVKIVPFLQKRMDFFNVCDAGGM
jgi:hypothetical protein